MNINNIFAELPPMSLTFISTMQERIKYIGENPDKLKFIGSTKQVSNKLLSKKEGK